MDQMPLCDFLVEMNRDHRFESGIWSGIGRVLKKVVLNMTNGRNVVSQTQLDCLHFPVLPRFFIPKTEGKVLQYCAEQML